MDSPIKIEVTKDKSRLRFDCLNRSYFPYEVVLNFSSLENLNPRILEIRKIAFPGMNVFQTFEIADPAISYGFKYSTEYRIGNPTVKADHFYPYLIPLGQNRNVDFETVIDPGRTTKMINNFVMLEGDTLFSVRKGIVTSTTKPDIINDRIFREPGLEIIHADGSVAVFTGLNDATILIKEGAKVFPCQPLAYLKSKSIVKLYIFEILGEGIISSFPFLYSNDDNNVIQMSQINGLTVNHPKEIIEKEFTKSELKKAMKGTLYKLK